MEMIRFRIPWIECEDQTIAEEHELLLIEAVDARHRIDQEKDHHYIIALRKLLEQSPGKEDQG